jgi:hypothetical protein
MTASIPRITGVSDLISEIDDALGRPEFSKEQTHVKIWFRGQPGSGSEWSLKPRVYRDDMANRNEHDRLQTERMLMQDFKLQSGALRNTKATDEELYFLQQHYRMPTRLLDWTTNPLASLFFAAQDPPDNKGGKDGELFMMDASAFRLTKIGEDRKYKSWVNERDFDFRGIADARHLIFRDSVRIISWFQADYNKFPNFIISVRPHHFDVRVGLQRSCFTFHVPNQNEITIDNNPSLTRFSIPTTEKPKIRQQLSTLGVDSFRIFGDLEHLSETLVNAYGLKR